MTVPRYMGRTRDVPGRSGSGEGSGGGGGGGARPGTIGRGRTRLGAHDGGWGSQSRDGMAKFGGEGCRLCFHGIGNDDI